MNNIRQFCTTIFLACLGLFMSPVTWVFAEDVTIPPTTSRADAPPRKVVIGTMIAPFRYDNYPGLSKRLSDLEKLIDQTAAQAKLKYPKQGLDLVVLPEDAVTKGKNFVAKERAEVLEGEILERMGAKARQYKTYLIVPFVMHELETNKVLNAAVLLDREGKYVGKYAKVYPVADLETNILEGGVTPGSEFPIFDCDFGKLGIQICFDLSYEEGWLELSRKGAEIVAVPSDSPQTLRPASYAQRGNYYVVMSTPRDNASIYNPLGMLDAQTTKRGPLVHEIDLSYARLSWSKTLHDGQVFRDKYGDRVGFTYYPVEDLGIFWSNDPQLPIGKMVRELHLVELDPQLARTRELQIRARGGEPQGAPRSGSTTANQ